MYSSTSVKPLTLASQHPSPARALTMDQDLRVVVMAAGLMGLPVHAYARAIHRLCCQIEQKLC
jgi:hypothetical protein